MMGVKHKQNVLILFCSPKPSLEETKSSGSQGWSNKANSVLGEVMKRDRSSSDGSNLQLISNASPTSVLCCT